MWLINPRSPPNPPWLAINQAPTPPPLVYVSLLTLLLLPPLAFFLPHSKSPLFYFLFLFFYLSLYLSPGFGKPLQLPAVPQRRKQPLRLSARFFLCIAFWRIERKRMKGCSSVSTTFSPSSSLGSNRLQSGRPKTMKRVKTQPGPLSPRNNTPHSPNSSASRRSSVYRGVTRSLPSLSLSLSHTHTLLFIYLFTYFLSRSFFFPSIGLFFFCPFFLL